jgi:hypothetical protein
MLATTQNNQKIIQGAEQPLADAASPTFKSSPAFVDFGKETVLSAGQQIVGAFKCISAQLQHASSLTSAPDVKAKYKAIQDKLLAHVGVINGTIDLLKPPTADKTTAIEAAQGLDTFLSGAPNVAGGRGVGFNATVTEAIRILGG